MAVLEDRSQRKAMVMKRALLVAAWVAVFATGCGKATRTVVVQPPPHKQPIGEVVPSQQRHELPEHAVYRSNGCGVERWAVKTLTDPGAANVTLRPQATWVGDLVSIDPPIAPTDRVNPTEDTVFRLSGVVQYVKTESDSDYHLVIVDSQGHSMIAESASPACAAGSRVLPQIEAVRRAVDARWPSHNVTTPTPVTVEGVGFFDRVHGQTGVAPNGIELHPLIGITFTAPPGTHAPNLHLHDSKGTD